jgi:hypothetical protein
MNRQFASWPGIGGERFDEASGWLDRGIGGSRSQDLGLTPGAPLGAACSPPADLILWMNSDPSFTE